MLTAAHSWRAATNRAPRPTIAFVTVKLPLPMSPKASVTPRSTSAVPTASATFIAPRVVLGRSRSETITALGRRSRRGCPRHRGRPPRTASARNRLSPGPNRSAPRTRSALALIPVEEVEDDRGKEGRNAEVVVGQAGQDRDRVSALRPSLAHPAAVAQSAVEQLEGLAIVARWAPLWLRRDAAR